MGCRSARRVTGRRLGESWGGLGELRDCLGGGDGDGHVRGASANAVADWHVDFHARPVHVKWQWDVQTVDGRNRTSAVHDLSHAADPTGFPVWASMTHQSGACMAPRKLDISHGPCPASFQSYASFALPLLSCPTLQYIVCNHVFQPEQAHSLAPHSHRRTPSLPLRVCLRLLI